MNKRNQKIRKSVNAVLVSLLSLSMLGNMIPVYAMEDHEISNTIENNVVYDCSGNVVNIVKNEETSAAEESFVLTNPEFGVTVTFTDSAVPEGLNHDQIGLQVLPLNEEQIQQAAELTEKNAEDVLAALDISLYNVETMEEIQPRDGGKVSVTIQAVKNVESVVEVARINDDNTATVLAADLSENHDATHDVTFETEHFTPYVVINSDSQTAFTNAIASAATDGSETVIELSSDITLTGGNTIEIPVGANIKIIGNGTIYRSADLAGSMFRVPSSSVFTLSNGVILDASRGEYTVVSGSKEESNRGVFVNVQGTLNIEGAVMQNIKTTGSNAANYVTAVYVTGSSAVVNFRSGVIKDMQLSGNMNHGGNQHSAGGFIIAGGATVNMTGGSIENNNVNWSTAYLPFFSNDDESLLLEVDAYDADDNHMNAVRAHTADLTKTEGGIWMGDNKNRGLTTGSKIDLPSKSTGRENYMDVRVIGGTEVEKTNSVGAVLILQGTMNFDGGEIKNNKADTGAIGIGGSDAWDTADYFMEGSERSKVLNMNGGVIDNNLGIYAGAVNVCPKGILNLNNGTISRNKSVLYGGGITAMRKTGSSDNWPEIIMKGGLIQNNRTRFKGGAMFILAEEGSIDLQAGTLDGNVADMMGGAIYLDQGFGLRINAYTEIANNTADDAYSGAVLHYESDPLQARLAAGAGGGIWLCPEGESNSNSLGYLYIHDNTASDAGDDMYKVTQAGVSRNQKIEVPTRDALGGLMTWYRDGGYDQAIGGMFTNNVMWRTSVNTYYDRDFFHNGDQHNTDGGEKYHEIGKEYSITPEGDFTQTKVTYSVYPRYTNTSNPETFTEAKNAYDAFAIKNVMQGTEEEVATRKALLSAMSTLKIINNKSSRGGGIGSDGILNFGDVSAYDENDFTITKTWDDPSEATEIFIYPYIEVIDEQGEKFEVDLEKIVLNASNNFTARISNLPYMINGKYLFEKDGDTQQYHSQLKFREEFPDGPNDHFAMVTDSIQLIDKEEEKKEITQGNLNGSHEIKVTTYHYGVQMRNTSATEFTVNKKWEEGSTPVGVQVQLYQNEQPVEGAVVELNKENGWTHTWKNLVRGYTYTAKEIASTSYEEIENVTVASLRDENRWYANEEFIMYSKDQGKALYYDGTNVVAKDVTINTDSSINVPTSEINGYIWYEVENGGDAARNDNWNLRNKAAGYTTELRLGVKDGDVAMLNITDANTDPNYEGTGYVSLADSGTRRHIHIDENGEVVWSATNKTDFDFYTISTNVYKVIDQWNVISSVQPSVYVTKDHQFALYAPTPENGANKVYLELHPITYNENTKEVVLPAGEEAHYLFRGIQQNNSDLYYVYNEYLGYATNWRMVNDTDRDRLAMTNDTSTNRVYVRLGGSGHLDVSNGNRNWWFYNAWESDQILSSSQTYNRGNNNLEFEMFTKSLTTSQKKTFVNRDAKQSFKVVKTWESESLKKEAGNITIQLLRDGEPASDVPNASITMPIEGKTGDDAWTYEWTDLPAGEYSVQEMITEGAAYEAVYSKISERVITREEEWKEATETSISSIGSGTEVIISSTTNGENTSPIVLGYQYGNQYLQGIDGQVIATQTEYENVPNTVIWTVQTDGLPAGQFYLYNETFNLWLTVVRIMEDEQYYYLETTTDENQRTAFELQIVESNGKYQIHIKDASNEDGQPLKYITNPTSDASYYGMMPVECFTQNFTIYYNEKRERKYGEYKQVATIYNRRPKGDIRVVKVDQNNNEIGLKDAEFMLFEVSKDQSNAPTYEPTQCVYGMTVTVPNTEETFGQPMVGTIISNPLVTNEDGVIQFPALAYGTYVMYETTAPDGYVLDSTPILFTMDSTGFHIQTSVTVGGKTFQYKNQDVKINATVIQTPNLGTAGTSIQITNQRISYLLPFTGGDGLNGTLLAGMMIVLVSGGWIYLMQRRKRNS